MPERLSRGSIPVVGYHAGHLDDLEILGLDPAKLGGPVGVPASIVFAPLMKLSLPLSARIIP